MDSETRFAETDTELDKLACGIASQSFRDVHHGGYSPYQFVSGVNPTLPADLLSADPTELQERVAADGVAAAFAGEIRQEARRPLFFCEVPGENLLQRTTLPDIVIKASRVDSWYTSGDELCAVAHQRNW